MFGGSSSPPKENSDSLVSQTSLTINTEAVSIGLENKNPSSTGALGGRQNEEYVPKTEKKRRSSSVAKAASFFSNAKNSLHFSSLREWSNSGSHGGRSFVVRYPTMDLDVSDPQAPSNSAGESLPTLRSSFRVGVTEDKNRKWRRTMEDTHAYLYNFLGTSPTTALDSPSTTEKTLRETTDTFTDPDERTHVAETDNGYFAIFDGHAGTFAADWCGKKLHLILEDIMKKNPNTPVPELLDQAFTSVDQQLEKLPLKNSGCTAVAAILRWEDRVISLQSMTDSTPVTPVLAATPKPEAETEATPNPGQTEQTSSSAVTPTELVTRKTKETTTRQRILYTANVGDARIVLCRSGKALRLSYDHKGSDENEGKRIANAGGLILNNRVNGVLAVTRALGDAYMKDLVTGHPYTTETIIQPDQDEFLILACDGVSALQCVWYTFKSFEICPRNNPH
jgi:protein phosphatase PTC1